jgi:hypothetical protein
LYKVFAILSVLSLSACDHFDQDSKDATVQVKKDAKTVEGNVTKNAMRVADNVRDSVKRTGEHMRDWWITPLPSNAKQPMPVRYCYRVLQDILCYRQQMIGWENKLVAYQGDGATPPTPATMKPLPLRADNKNILPEKHVEAMKPVFSAASVLEKKSQSSIPVVEGSTAIDPAYEIIQDSALSPQL